jgi:hypothetical protein
MPTQIQIRRLAPADAALYRDIRLEGLRCNPEAFGSTFKAENARPLTFFADRPGGWVFSLHLGSAAQNILRYASGGTSGFVRS